VCGVEGCGEKTGVDGGCDELFEGAGGGEIERSLQGCVGECCVGAGQWEEREEEKLLMLLGGECW